MVSRSSQVAPATYAFILFRIPNGCASPRTAASVSGRRIRLHFSTLRARSSSARALVLLPRKARSSSPAATSSIATPPTCGRRSLPAARATWSAAVTRKPWARWSSVRTTRFPWPSRRTTRLASRSRAAAPSESVRRTRPPASSMSSRPLALETSLPCRTRVQADPPKSATSTPTAQMAAGSVTTTRATRSTSIQRVLGRSRLQPTAEPRNACGSTERPATSASVRHRRQPRSM